MARGVGDGADCIRMAAVAAAAAAAAADTAGSSVDTGCDADAAARSLFVTAAALRLYSRARAPVASSTASPRRSRPRNMICRRRRLVCSGAPRKLRRRLA